MSAKHFFIAHGEKVALSVTLLFCAAQLAVTFTDDSIRPSEGITTAVIDAKNTAIDAVFLQGKAPVMKAVPPYLEDMDRRFDAQISLPAVPSWLLASPDRGPGSGGLLLYVMELPAPSVTATDAVGAVELTITLPTSVRQPGKRIADNSESSWLRDAEGIENHARQLGVLIETHRGDNQWKPLINKDIIHGFMSLEALAANAGTVIVDGLEPWIRHSFRVRLVGKATALDLSQPLPAKVSSSVVVVSGRLVSELEDVGWADFTERIRAKDAKTLSKLAPLAPPLPGVSLGPAEKAFLGAPSEDAAVQVTSDIRFALDKVGAALDDPKKNLATFLVTKQFTDKDDGKLWLKEPQTFKAAVGDIVGGEAKGENPLFPGKIVILKLSTPFRVVEIKRGQKRIQYWEIREKSRIGGKGKDLDAVAKEAQTDIVVVENIKTKNRLTLTRLTPIKLPPRKNAILFPHLSADLDEEQEFRKNPADFVQQELLPDAPKVHQPGEGPLEKLRAEHPDAADLYATDTPYFELGDGRLVWWEPLNKTIRQDPEPAMNATSPGTAPAPDAAPKVAPASPRIPPGSPPGAIPEAGIPPAPPSGLRPPRRDGK
jgi:hypothetical protein